MPIKTPTGGGLPPYASGSEEEGYSLDNMSSLNNTRRVAEDENLQTALNNAVDGETIIVENGPNNQHMINQTAIVNNAITLIVFEPLVPTGDFSALEVNSFAGTFRVAAFGNGSLADDANSNTTSSTDGVVFHNNIQTYGRPMVANFGRDNIVFLQASTGDKTNHSIYQFYSASAGRYGLRIANTSGESQNVSGHYGFLQVYNSGDYGLQIEDGGRHEHKVIGAAGANGTGNAVISEGVNTHDNLYWVEEEEYGINFKTLLNASARAYVIHSDNIKQGGWLGNIGGGSTTWRGSDATLDARQYREAHVDGGVTVTIDNTEVPQGTLFIVKDYDGTAGTTAITIDTAGTGTIDGGSSIQITTDNGFRQLIQVASGMPNMWKVIGSN